MTSQEWTQILAWIGLRWPGGLTPSQAAALYTDLEDVPAEDVQAALKSLYEAGRDYCPTPSVIVAKTKEWTRINAVRRRQTSLPVPGIEWKDYARAVYGREDITITEAAELEARKERP